MKKLLNSAPAQRALTWLLTQYVRLVMATQNWRVEGGENLRIVADDAPRIAVFWHETLPAIPALAREARKAGMTRPCVVLASRHRNGQLIGNIMVNLGMEQVSGSTSKGGAAGLRALVKALEEGKNAALTPDGPRGPRHVAAPGVAQLAAATGALVLPCAAATSRAITLKSWDRMRLALPFGRGMVVVGAPISVPHEGWEASLPIIQAALNAALERAMP